MQDETSRGRLALGVLVWVAAFPAMWPLYLLRGGWRAAAHAKRMKRIDGSATEQLLDRVRAGEAKGALISTLGWTTMASGPEEETCVELRLGGAEGETTEVLAWSEELDALLTAQQVPRTSVETYRQGLTLIFGWGLWIAVVFGIMGAVTGAALWLLLAGITLIALLALARM